MTTEGFYPMLFEFEKNFDQGSARHWVQANWVPLCSSAGFVYLLLIYLGRRWMASRPPFDLRSSLAAWSFALAIFSILGFLRNSFLNLLVVEIMIMIMISWSLIDVLCRTVPELVDILSSKGLRGSVCDPAFLETNKVSAFWTWLFTLSKLVELGDTAFIVLRKQKLIFLHWYHHLSVLISVFYCFSNFTPYVRWFMVMNYMVHSVMYSYYTLKALRIQVPRGIAAIITSLQIVQMLVNTAINFLAFRYLRSREGCPVDGGNLAFTSFVVLSYLALFLKFFHNAYCLPKVEADSNGKKSD